MSSYFPRDILLSLTVAVSQGLSTLKGHWPLKRFHGLISKSCLTLLRPMDCSPPGSSVHWISQSRILDCIAISFSRGSSQPRSPAMQADSVSAEPPEKPSLSLSLSYVASCGLFCAPFFLEVSATTPLLIDVCAHLFVWAVPGSFQDLSSPTRGSAQARAKRKH